MTKLWKIIKEKEKLASLERPTSFFSEIKESKDGICTTFEFFFRDFENNLIWYIKLNLVDNEFSSDLAYMIDVTTASWYDFLPEIIRWIYDNSWYNPLVKYKWYATFFVEYVLKYIRENYPQKRMVLVACLPQNYEKLRAVITDVNTRVDWIRLMWWSDIHAFTIKFE